MKIRCFISFVNLGFFSHTCVNNYPKNLTVWFFLLIRGVGCFLILTSKLLNFPTYLKFKIYNLKKINMTLKIYSLPNRRLICWKLSQKFLYFLYFCIILCYNLHVHYLKTSGFLQNNIRVYFFTFNSPQKTPIIFYRFNFISDSP